MFQFKLPGVLGVLVLASAACAEVRTRRRDAITRGLQDLQQPRPSEFFLHLGDLDLDLLAEADEWDKYDKIVCARDTFPAECDVLNRGDQPLPNANWKCRLLAAHRRQLTIG